MEVLSALQLTCSFFLSIMLCFVDRNVCLYIIEGFVGLGGLVMCLFPRFFYDTHLDLLGLRQDGSAEASNLFLLHLLGGIQLSQVLISFLSRTRSKDETVSRNAMTMWAQRICLDIVVYTTLLSVKGTEERTVGDKKIEVFDLRNITEYQVSVFLVILGVFISTVVQLVKWPVYRARISMTTRDPTNLYLLLLEIYFFSSGILIAFFPECMGSLPGFTWKFGRTTQMYGRSIGIVKVIVAGYIHSAQSYYDNRDKAPVFQAVMFVQLTNLVHYGVYFYQLPGDFPLHSYMIAVFFASLVFFNCCMGLLTAKRNFRPQIKTSVTDDSYFKSISSETEDEEEEGEEGNSFRHVETHTETKIVRESFESDKSSGKRSTRQRIK